MSRRVFSFYRAARGTLVGSLNMRLFATTADDNWSTLCFLSFRQDVADTLSNLGECALKTGRTKEATDFYRRALEIEEESFGADQPVLGSTLHCLGLCAEQVTKRACFVFLIMCSLSCRDVSLRPSIWVWRVSLSCGVSRSLPTLRTSCFEILVAPLSLRFQRKINPMYAASTQAHTHTRIHVYTYTRTNARTHAQDGRAEEAQEYFRRSLAIEEKQMGEEHPHVAATLADLAASSLASGSTEEVEGLLRRALAITEKTATAETGTLHCLADCTRKRGRHAEAEGLLRRALAIEQGSNGTPATSGSSSVFASASSASGAGAVATTLGELASCACEAGKAEQAEEWFRKALAEEEERLGKGHRDVAATLTRLGKCLSQQSKVEEAAAVHRRALSIIEETDGDRCLEVMRRGWNPLA